jgi:hypothetical protein
MKSIFSYPLKHPNLTLFVICAATLIFRLYGISLGIGTHPDERHIMMVTEKLSWQNLNPKSFAYGSLPFYLLRAVASTIAYIFPKSNAGSYDGLFIVGRYLMVFLAIATIVATYVLARVTGLAAVWAVIAATFLALNLFHIQLSHYFTVDPILTLTSVLALIGISLIVRTGSWKAYIFAGIMIGCSLAVKISALNLFLPLMLAHAIRTWNHRNQWLITQLKIINALFLIVIFGVGLQPYLVLDYSEFMRQVKEQISMVQGGWTPPYTLQYLHTTPYLYPLEQMFNYTIGAPLMIFALIGSFLLLFSKGSSATVRLIVIWAVAVFLVFGRYQVKFPRYLLTIYPVLFIAAADTLRRIRFAPYLTAVLFAFGILQGIAWMNLYNYEHSYQLSSRWIFAHIPEGKSILSVHWDDKVPIDLPGFSSHTYKMWDKEQELPLYEPDEERKIQGVSKQLADGDYIAFPTQRLPGSILQVPERYPFTAPLMQLLYAEHLGYRMIKTIKVRPKFMFYTINDDVADESLSVYDHPKVTIFENTEHLSQEEITRRIRSYKEFGALPDKEEVLLKDME